jgi:hypothetical protein
MLNGASVHWTQKPENRLKLKRVLKQAAVAKRAKDKLSKAERIVKKQVKAKKIVPTAEDEASIIVNGWKLTLGPGRIKIEQS